MPAGEPRPEQVAQLVNLIEQAHDAIVVASPEGLITMWNPAAERLFGHSAVDAIGRPLAILVPDDARAQDARLIACALAGEATTTETSRLCRDGGSVAVSLSVSPIVG